MSGNNPQQLQSMLHEIGKRPGNLVCAECPAANPTHCSFLKPVATRETVAVFVCEGCSKHHRRLGMHFSEAVKPVTSSEWTRREISVLHKTGNEFVNAFYETTGDVENDKDIDPEDDPKLRSAFIKLKYIRRKFFSIEKYHEAKSKRDKSLQQQQQEPQTTKQRRHSTMSAKKSSSDNAANATTPATPRTLGRRRATLASATTTRQQKAMLANTKNSDLLDLSDVIEPDESEPESEPEEAPAPPRRALTLEEKSLSSRSLMRRQPAPPRALGDALQMDPARNNNNNPMTLPSGLTTPQQKARASIGLDMFLTLSQEQEEGDGTGKKDNKKGRRAKKFMRRCMSVSGTDDTRKPKKEEEEEASVNTAQSEDQQMYGDRVAGYKVDASSDVQRLKAAKLAKKSRKARRRASVSVMSTESGSSRTTKSPHENKGRNRTKSPAERKERDSPSPTSVREETRMSQSMIEQQQSPPAEEENATKPEGEAPMSQSERLKAKLSSTREARRASTRGGGPRIVDVQKPRAAEESDCSESESDRLGYETPQYTAMSQSERPTSMRGHRAARRASARGGLGSRAAEESESEAEADLGYEPHNAMCQSERPSSMRAHRAARRASARGGGSTRVAHNNTSAMNAEETESADLGYEPHNQNNNAMCQSERPSSMRAHHRAARRASARGGGSTRVMHNTTSAMNAEETESEAESDYETPHQTMTCQSERADATRTRADRAALRASLRGAARADPLGGGSNHSISRIRARRGSLRGGGVPAAEPQQRRQRGEDPLSLSSHSTSNSNSRATHRAASKPLLREGSDPTLRDRRARRDREGRRMRKSKTMNEATDPASTREITAGDRRGTRRNKTMGDESEMGRAKKGTRRPAKRVSSKRDKEEPDHKWDSSDKKKEEEPDFQWNQQQQQEGGGDASKRGERSLRRDRTSEGGDASKRGERSLRRDRSGEGGDASRRGERSLRRDRTSESCGALAEAFKIPGSSQAQIGAGRRASVAGGGEVGPRRGGPRKRSQSMLPPQKDKPYENQIIQQWHSGYWPSQEDEARAAEKAEEELAPGAASRRRASRRHASTGGVRKSKTRSGGDARQ